MRIEIPRGAEYDQSSVVSFDHGHQVAAVDDLGQFLILAVQFLEPLGMYLPYYQVPFQHYAGLRHAEFLRAQEAEEERSVCRKSIGQIGYFCVAISTS